TLLADLLSGANNPALVQAADTLLLRPGLLPLSGVVTIVGYPLLPWLGVVAAGYGFGAIVRLEPRRRRQVMGATGIAMTAAFVIVRSLNVGGDPRPWTTEASSLRTALSFL